jgi:predicted nucleotidyltransferase component of viral defense system
MLLQSEKKWAQENLVFKGGTCLKKCYFEKYCFSQNELVFHHMQRKVINNPPDPDNAQQNRSNFPKA